MKIWKAILLSLLLAAVTQAYCTPQDTLHWHRLAPLPTEPLTDFGYFVLDSNLYIIGGSDSTLVYRSGVWRYNFPTDTWYKMNDFPGGPCADMASFALNGKGYVCAGLDSVQAGCDSLFWDYDPTLDSWQLKGSYPGPPRELNNQAVFTYLDKAYVGTGIQCGVTFLNDMWEYNGILDQWIKKADMLVQGRSGVSSTQVDSFAYLVGGFTNSTDGFSDFWRYNIALNSWDSLGNVPGLDRSNCLSWGFKSEIIVGYGFLSDSTSLVLGKDLYRYNINLNFWDTLRGTGFVDSVAASCTFSIGSRGYILGGTRNNNYGFYNDFWYFDLDESTHTGITSPVADSYTFQLYPTLISGSSPIHLHSSYRGTIDFYDALGQLIYTTALDPGLTTISADKLGTPGLIFYRATLQGGHSDTGKLIHLH